MKAIILAAGKGERLYPLTRNTPKSLLELGEGITVLENQIENLLKSGIKEIVIVTGYKSEQIEAKIKDEKRLSIKIVFNPFYETCNNLISAWMAKYEMNNDFILINGDDVFHYNVVNELLKNSDEICMVIDRKQKYEAEDMKVKIINNHVVTIGKNISVNEANGESIGMIKFQGMGIYKFVSTMEEMVRSKNNFEKFWLAALQKIMDSGFKVNYYECAPAEWGEIDFHPDLQYIKRNLNRYYHAISEK